MKHMVHYNEINLLEDQKMILQKQSAMATDIQLMIQYQNIYMVRQKSVERIEHDSYKFHLQSQHRARQTLALK